MASFIFTKKAKKVFESLPATVQERILFKLRSLKAHQDIFTILKGLQDLAPATHRLRVGSYRLILQLSEGDGNVSSQQIDPPVFRVLDLGHRRDIYKKKAK